MAEQNIVNPDGTAKGTFTESNAGRVSFQVGAEPQDAPVEQHTAPIHRTGGQAIRVQVGADGQMEVSRSQARGASVNTATSPTEASAMNAMGQKIDLTRASASDVATLPALGDSSIASWVTMGILRPRLGGGFEFVNARPAVSPSAPPTATPETAAPAPYQADPVDVRNIPPTSEASDSFQRSLRPAVAEQLIATIATGAYPDFQEIGRQAGESEEFAARAEQLHGELIASGQAVLRNVGVDNPESFQAWAIANRREQTGDAVRAMTERDVSKLAQLGREYVADRTNRIEQRISAAGVDTKRENGVLYIARKDLGLPVSPRQGDFGGNAYISLADAVRGGHVEIVGE